MGRWLVVLVAAAACGPRVPHRTKVTVSGITVAVPDDAKRLDHGDPPNDAAFQLASGSVMSVQVEDALPGVSCAEMIQALLAEPGSEAREVAGQQAVGTTVEFPGKTSLGVTLCEGEREVTLRIVPAGPTANAADRAEFAAFTRSVTP